VQVISNIADWLTEQLLSGVVPDVVELGTSRFRRLRGTFAEGRFQIIEPAEVPAPKSFVCSPAIPLAVFDNQAFKEAFMKLFETHRPRHRYVAIILPDGIFHIGFSSISAVLLKSGVSSFIEREVQQTAPMPLGEYKVQFEIGAGKGNKKDLLFCCLAQKVFSELFELFEEMGFVPISIQPSFVNLMGAIKLLESDSSPHPSVLIHLGNEVTTVAIVLGGNIRRIQALPLGGVDFNKFLSRGLSIKDEEAEKLKFNEIILLEEPSEEAQLEIVAYRALEPLFTDLLQRIYGFLQIHSSEFPHEGSFRRIIFSGGGSGFRNLDRLIVSNLGLPVVRIGRLLRNLPGLNGFGEEFLASFSPLLGAISMRPWHLKHFDRIVA